MKILYVSGMYPTPKFPQKGIFSHEQVKALKKRGVDIDVVVPYTFYDREIESEYWDYEGVNIRYIKYFKIPGTADFHRSGKALFHSLNRNLDLESYDIYHADAALPVGQAVMYAAKKYNKKYIIHGHGLDVFLDVSYKDKKNCNKIVDASKEVYANADAFIGVSQKVVDNVLERLDISGKTYVAYNGVDVENFYPETHENEKIQIISVGNLIPLKGHDYTLRALKVLNDKYPNKFCMKLLGRGYLEQNLKDLALELGLDDIVEFVGYIPYDKLASEVRKGDIFVLPSYYEALGCVYLEAMACGLPSVGCKNNGIDEIIEDGVDGFLIDVKNVDQIVESAEKLMDNNVRSEMAKKARAKVESNYTWDASAKVVEDIYRKLFTV
ncbi:MAG: glycosyltransferase [Ruminococcus sp.]|nr:glycosyltransferase [Ruminococcus sp.]